MATTIIRILGEHAGALVVEPLLFKRGSATETPRRHGSGILWLFFILHLMGGHVGLPIVILFASWKKRPLIFLNFLFTWVLYSVSFCLLLYTNQHKGPEPGRGLCMVQASLVYAVPVLTATSLLAMVLRPYLESRSLRKMEQKEGHIPTHTFILLFAPYLMAIPFMALPLILGTNWSDSVNRENSFFYCSSSMTVLTVISASVVFVILSAVVALQIVGWKRLRYYQKVQSSNDGSGVVDKTYFWVRTLVFTGYLIIALVACALAIFMPDSTVRVIIQATAPVVVYFVFGTNPELYRA